MNKKIINSFILLTTLAFSDEVSVFGAGDLTSPNPYGLNNTEKNILKNKKQLGSIDTKVKSVKLSLKSISERIDGLESIYEGDSQKLNSSIFKINEMVKKLDETSNISTKNQKDIENLKLVTSQLLTMQEEFSKTNQENVKSLKKAISELTLQLSKINNSYISDKEFKKNMKQFVTIKEFDELKKIVLNNKKPSTNKKAKVKANKNLTYKQKDKMLKEAKQLFKKDYFTKAIPIFEELAQLNFKPAEANFYLGEMWYYRNKYKKAIAYFKKSAVLHDKAEWMPKLLLHSAISFEKTKDYDNAKNFYNTLIDVYPNSKEANIATKNILKL